MRFCEIGELLVSAYAERRFAIESRNESEDAMIQRVELDESTRYAHFKNASTCC
jgi:hypothetical protein